MEAIAYFVWPALAFAVLAALGLTSFQRRSADAPAVDKVAELDGRVSALENEVTGMRKAPASVSPIRRKSAPRTKVAASRS